MFPPTLNGGWHTLSKSPIRTSAIAKISLDFAAKAGSSFSTGGNMQSAAFAQKSEMRFDDPVRVLLDQKGHSIWWISPESTVYQAIQLMSEKQVGALLVMSEGQLAGIVS